MDDTSTTIPYPFGSSLGSISLKRRRIDNGSPQVPGQSQAASIIPDKRISAARALKLDCDILTITVGQDPDKRTFKIHEDAICDRSSFFRNAMKPEWASMRSDPRAIELPEDDPEAFALYRTWLYSGQLAILPDPNTNTVSQNQGSNDASAISLQGDAAPEHYHTLAYAYILGERLLDIPFKNAIVDAYVLYARGAPPGKRYYPSNEEIRILYDGTGEGSPIRQLLVDIWYCRGKVEWVDKDGPDAGLPAEFLRSVVKELLRVRVTVEQLSRPWKLTHVQYHEKDRLDEV